ncbi:hypothetical protein KCP75_23970 [Salmonella enterica subsp. enterica]|nr:hypothetical protein KCP75_23970 [Salmonella enterica subsp. enterica]
MVAPLKLRRNAAFRSEFMRRQKRTTAQETQGLVRVGYQGLERRTVFLLTGRLKEATLDDWRDFLKVTLDFYVQRK